MKKLQGDQSLLRVWWPERFSHSTMWPMSKLITLFYQHLTVLDFAYLDKDRGVVGDSLVVDISLTGLVDDEGVIFDFSNAKQLIKKIIDEQVDHRLVIPKGMLQSTATKKDFGFHYNYGLEYQKKSLTYFAPRQAFCEITQNQVTLETLKEFLENIILKEMPQNITKVSIALKPESNKSDQYFFNYTHGLKNHYGNCQRLLHGHRNTIEIWCNKARQLHWEKKLVEEVFSKNIHFCWWENVVNKSELLALNYGKVPHGKISKQDVNLLDQVGVEIFYTGNQGDYFANLPLDEVFFVPLESTVENLSVSIGMWIKEYFAKPNDQIKVIAFEGIGKGALAEL